MSGQEFFPARYNIRAGAPQLAVGITLPENPTINGGPPINRTIEYYMLSERIPDTASRWIPDHVGDDTGVARFITSFVSLPGAPQLAVGITLPENPTINGEPPINRTIE